MPAGSEGTECGQRSPQRLAITEVPERPPRRREAVLLMLTAGGCASGALALGSWWVT